MAFQLTYVSVAERRWTRAELKDLLHQARSHNAEIGVTGVLLYREGRFLQLLEGSRDEVRRLYASIVADARHHDVTTVRESRRLVRQFPSWTMAFRDLGEDPLRTPGYSDVLNGDGEQPDKAVNDLVAHLRASGRSGRAGALGNRVLGLLG